MTATDSRVYKPKATAKTVAANVHRLRVAQNFNIPELGRRLEGVGHPMTATSITRLEAGRRRIDVDDVMALATVLGVTPVALLLPSFDEESERAEVTGAGEVDAAVLWGWALGNNALRPFDDPEVVLRRSLPAWLLQQRQAAARQRDIAQERNTQLHELLTRYMSSQHNGDD